MLFGSSSFYNTPCFLFFIVSEKKKGVVKRGSLKQKMLSKNWVAKFLLPAILLPNLATKLLGAKILQPNFCSKTFFSNYPFLATPFFLSEPEVRSPASQHDMLTTFLFDYFGKSGSGELGHAWGSEENMSEQILGHKFGAQSACPRQV